MKENHEAASSAYGYLHTIAKIDGLVDVRVLIHLARQAVHQVIHVAEYGAGLVEPDEAANVLAKINSEHKYRHRSVPLSFQTEQS